jgi:hypothetical protein
MSGFSIRPSGSSLYAALFVLSNMVRKVLAPGSTPHIAVGVVAIGRCRTFDIQYPLAVDEYCNGHVMQYSW